MKKVKIFAKKITVILFLLMLSMQINAQEIMIAVCAGYKKPFTEVIQVFEKSTKVKVTSVFGNIQMVSIQAKQTGEICCIIGDDKFLRKVKTTVTFKNYYPIGKGLLVLAYRKGFILNSPEDLVTDRVHSVFMPKDGKAIYGIASAESIKSYGFEEKLNDKLTQVSTVPQVVSYLHTGEADAGFINITEALANRENIGGYIMIPEDKYTKIDIVAGVINGFENKLGTREFIKFLSSDQAKSIFEKYGLK